jgi:hypothetical protein
MGDSFMNLVKSDKSGSDNGLHPNITKFLAPNVTLNSYELEILQVEI